MYNARFETDDGRIFRFGYEYGNIFDIEPLSEIDVEVATSQGFQQIGESVENQSVSGLSRTISGKFIKQANGEKRQLLNVFTPFTSGKLYFGENYYCDAFVQKTPALGAGEQDADFSLMLYCAYPYWLKAMKSTFTIGGYTPSFSFPVNYSIPHRFGIKNPSAFTNCINSGAVNVEYTAEFTAEAPVVNYGLINIYTLEYIKLIDTLNIDEKVRIYRKEGRLYIEKVIGDEIEDIFSTLDEDSTLFLMRTGDNVLRATADSGVENLIVSVTFNETYTGVYDGM